MKNLIGQAMPDRRASFANLPGLASAAAVAVSVAFGALTVPAPSKAATPVSPTAESAPLKVGFVYVSPITDAGWTRQHERGRLHLQQTLGDQVQTRAVANVAEGSDAERVIRDLAAQGHALIFATSFGYMAAVAKVAREFPHVRFEHAGGFRQLPNLATYNARHYEGRYLSGIVAGAVTQSNTLGYVAALPIPEVIQGINAFTIGARTVNPLVQVRVIWTGSWFDPGGEKAAATALVDAGADVLTHHTDSSAVPREGESRGIAVIGYHSDMRAAAPTRLLTSVTHEWGDYYVRRARAVIADTWESGNTWAGLGEGFTALQPGSLPDAVFAVREQVEQANQAIRAARLHPFDGPLKDDAGTIRVAAGVRPDDAALQAMDWFVDGVVSAGGRP